MADGKRPVPPPLEYRWPDCSLCDKQTYHDGDGFACEFCRCYWSTDYESPGNWDDPNEEFCGQVIEPYKDNEHSNIRDYRFVCALPVNHDGSHVGVMQRDHFTDTYTWRESRNDH